MIVSTQVSSIGEALETGGFPFFWVIAPSLLVGIAVFIIVLVIYKKREKELVASDGDIYGDLFHYTPIIALLFGVGLGFIVYGILLGISEDVLEQHVEDVAQEHIQDNLAFSQVEIVALDVPQDRDVESVTLTARGVTDTSRAIEFDMMYFEDVDMLVPIEHFDSNVELPVIPGSSLDTLLGSEEVFLDDAEVEELLDDEAVYG